MPNKLPNLTKEDIIKSAKKSAYTAADHYYLNIKLSWTSSNITIPIITILGIQSYKLDIPDKEAFYSFYREWQYTIDHLIKDFNLEYNIDYNEDCLDKFIEC